mgnify:CR=1 FL=1
MPRRIVTILEGESLLNDATALVALRTAVAAVGGTVSVVHVGLEFLLAAGSSGIEAATNIVVRDANRKMLLYVYAAVIVLCFITFRSWRAVIVAVVILRSSRRLGSVWWAVALGGLLGGLARGLLVAGHRCGRVQPGRRVRLPAGDRDHVLRRTRRRCGCRPGKWHDLGAGGAGRDRVRVPRTLPRAAA